MESLSPILVLALNFSYTVYVLTSTLRHRTSSRTALPPGPRPKPIIGNILELGQKPHIALTNLAKIYGPLMTLRLGSITTIVISSPNIAKEALQKHDQALSSRTVPDSARGHDHHINSMVWLPVSPRWRNLRKICATEMFTMQRLDASQELRRKKVQELLDYVRQRCQTGEAVDIGSAGFTTVLNLISNTFISVDMASYNSDSSQEFSKIVQTIMEDVGKPNIADYFPMLNLFDPQGVRRRVSFNAGKLLRIFDGIIKERMQRLSESSVTSKTKHDVLDALLILIRENDNNLTTEDVRHLLLDFFVAGTDTTSVTLEWAMSELLTNPEKLAKLNKELKKLDGQEIRESDISELPYLQAVVKETFRLHPPVPFLVPHKAETEVKMCGFEVPKDAQIWVNVFAIGRDRHIWTNPDEFMPERFIERKIELKGNDFELIPFGSGRRICPGLSLAQRMLHLMLASLLHSFNWKLADGQKPENLDMEETFGISLHKSEPLLALPTII